MIYLGSSIAGLSSASGADIPGIQSQIMLQDTSIHLFDPVPTNLTANYAAPWTDVPDSLLYLFNPAQTPALTQASNPANMVGWNSRWASNLMRANGGDNLDLLTRAQKSLKKTLSYSGSYQGFFWNNALVATLGWRFDTVKTKDVTAGVQPANRNILQMADNIYKLPDEFPATQIVKGHSLAKQGVLHLNRILEKDFLPINVSLSYANSSNFQVTSIRRDLYGTPIGNPSGETKEYGVLLATKDRKSVV